LAFSSSSCWARAAAAAAPAEAARPANVTEFKSPLVGTFYRSAKPDSDAFVNIGDEVGPEKVLCIIEAMKVMNEIKAEMSGVVRDILTKSGLHPHGIKVRLESGIVGRVKEILDG